MAKIKGLKYGGKPVELINSVKNLEDNKCPEPRCGKVLERHLIDNTIDKMYTIVACPAHPYKAWADIFSKTSYAHVQDWTNRDKRFS